MTAMVSALMPSSAAGATAITGAAGAAAGWGGAAGSAFFFVGSMMWVSSMSPHTAVSTAKTMTMLMTMITKGLSVTG